MSLSCRELPIVVCSMIREQNAKAEASGTESREVGIKGNVYHNKKKSLDFILCSMKRQSPYKCTIKLYHLTKFHSGYRHRERDTHQDLLFIPTEFRNLNKWIPM